ncbi:hypothetical protein [Actinoplanes sp. NPDC051859]|uniref:hypothetical protein n=1 Tax=Actinoplanes sp. NPDC051859 TaxID=3363909 RepID=UPI003795FA47
MSGARRAAIVVAVLALAASGCSSGGSDSDDSYRPPDTSSATTSTKRATPQTEATATRRVTPQTEAAVAQPPKPQGTVPRGALGIWVGGLGSKSDFTFIVVSKGQYQLEHRATPAIPAFVEQGWVVGDGDELLLRPVNARGINARERTVSWFRQPNSVGLDLLVIGDPVFGELDYVRDDS